MIGDFNDTIDAWINALDNYSLEQLEVGWSANEWSIGQLYMHLIQETDFYILQINDCTACDNNATEPIKESGRALLLANSFPNKRLQGPPSNAHIPQPESKQDLVLSLLNTKAAMNAAFIMVKQTPFAGKTSHPVHGYMCAAEWMQFTILHLRHHLRQKNRLDENLSIKHDDREQGS